MGDVGDTAEPNVLWFLCDELRGQALGSAGDPNARTPNLDAFAAQSLRFTQAVSMHPLCVPFRGALLTGQQSNNSGITGHESRLAPDALTVAHVLTGIGYDTAYFGKWHLGDHSHPAGGGTVSHAIARRVVPTDRRGGFRYWDAFEGGDVFWDPWLHRNGDSVARRVTGYQSDVLVDRFLEFADGPHDRPWFAIVSAEAPHPPYDAAPARCREHFRPDEIVLRPNVPPAEPVESQARAELAGYYAHLEATDAAFGRLIAALDTIDDGRETLVFFFSDHGDMLGSHGMFRKTRPYEESIRIPLLVRWPGKLAPADTDELIGEIDFLPTVLGLLGHRSEIPSGVDGIDLSPALRGEASGLRTAALIQQVDPFAFTWGCGIPWRAVRTADALYGCTEREEQWLFDLQTDPYQLRNIVFETRRPQLRSQLRARLKAELASCGDRFRVPESMVAAPK